MNRRSKSSGSSPAYPGARTDHSVPNEYNPGPRKLDSGQSGLSPSQKAPPEARAALGRALGRLNLDDRPGVGLLTNKLPDINWVEIPGGQFLYQDEKKPRKNTRFSLARYPSPMGSSKPSSTPKTDMRRTAGGKAWTIRIGASANRLGKNPTIRAKP